MERRRLVADLRGMHGMRGMRGHAGRHCVIADVELLWTSVGPLPCARAAARPDGGDLAGDAVGDRTGRPIDERRKSLGR